MPVTLTDGFPGWEPLPTPPTPTEFGDDFEVPEHTQRLLQLYLLRRVLGRGRLKLLLVVRVLGRNLPPFLHVVGEGRRARGGPLPAQLFELGEALGPVELELGLVLLAGPCLLMDHRLVLGPDLVELGLELVGVSAFSLHIKPILYRPGCERRP